MQYWQENVKTSYEGDMDFSVPVPGAKDKPQLHLEGGFLELDKYGRVPCTPSGHA